MSQNNFVKKFNWKSGDMTPEAVSREFQNLFVTLTRLDSGTETWNVVSTNSLIARGITNGVVVPAGDIGEIIESIFGAKNYPTSGQWGDATSINLTPGIWSVNLNLTASAAGATVPQIEMGISSTAGNSSTGLADGDTEMRDPGPVNGVCGASQSLSGKNITITANTTYYFKYFATYTVATPQAAGRITAFRVA